MPDDKCPGCGETFVIRRDTSGAFMLRCGTVFHAGGLVEYGSSCLAEQHALARRSLSIALGLLERWLTAVQPTPDELARETENFLKENGRG